VSVRDETALLARELAALATTRASRDLSPDGLDIAVLARAETIALARQVLADVTGINRHDTGRDTHRGNPRRSVEALESHPVGLLSRALAAHPVPRPTRTLAPSDIATARPGGGAGVAGWSRVARHALLAGHEWSTRPPVPDPAQQWSAVADVAALAQVVTVLDHDLLGAARDHGGTHPDLTDALTAATTSGLRSAAYLAGALADAGPLPDWGDPGPESSPTQILVVRSPEDVAAAQTRITAQVEATDDIGPHKVALTATAQARVLATAAVALATTDPARAAGARHLSGVLAAGLTTAHRLAGLAPGDARPVLQSRELLQHLGAVGAQGWTTASAAPYLPALALAVDRSPAVLRALSRHARQCVHDGRWLVVNTDAEKAGDPMWRPLTREDPEPRLCAALSAAAARATAMPGSAPPPVSATAIGAPPRQALAGLAARDPRPRPARPAHLPETGRE
jgi:hypothetical protein